MKFLLTTLGSLTIAGSSTAVFLNSTNNLVSTQEKAEINEFSNPSTLSKSSQTIEEYLENNQKNTLKEDILASLFFRNGKVEINVSILEQYKNNPNLYLILTSAELKENLLRMYQDDLLIYNQETQEFSFKILISNFSWGIWAEAKWYWFGWWKLHFNHEASQDISNILLTASSIGEFTELVAVIAPEYAVFIAAASIMLMANNYIFSHYDKGNGIWIGFLGRLPDMGWGSN